MFVFVLVFFFCHWDVKKPRSSLCCVCTGFFFSFPFSPSMYLSVFVRSYEVSGLCTHLGCSIELFLIYCYYCFQELNSTVPFLEIRSINNAPPCKSKELLLLILDIINREGGGVFLGEDVSLARAPNPDKLDPVAVWFSHPLKEQKESLTFDKRRGLDPKCLAREKQAATLHSESFSVDYSRCLVFVKHSFNADLLDLPHALDSASSG